LEPGVIIKTIAEKLALRMLAGSGDAVIQNALIAAAAARVAGKLEAAAALVEIAEAAERLLAGRAAAEGASA
jgi:hypothetical protein